MYPCLSEEQLEPMLRQDLSAHEMNAVLVHLDECAECRTLVAALARQLPDQEQADAPLLVHEGPRRGENVLLRSGQRVGNYRILHEIGKGAMGSVFAAIHLLIERRAAIKVLFADLAQEPELASRFVNEARAVNLVRHPGLVEIYEIGELRDGKPYIIMEYLEGESLAARLTRSGGRLQATVAQGVVRQMAAALLAVHHKGIVHRDLKPHNTMLVADEELPGRERVKILDFGLAKFTGVAPLESSASGVRTRTGMIMGTPEYMAPEQCLGSAQVDGKADVYSLGVMFYEMLCGHRPFAGAGPLQVMHQQLSATPVPLRQHDPAIDERLAALVAGMLAKHPTQRPDLEDVLRTLDQGAPPTQQIAALVPGGPGVSEQGLCATLPRQGQAPSGSSPFLAGPPISDPRFFFGRHRELKRICNLWRQPPLQNAAVIGPRRSGKTSLLLRLKALADPSLLRPGQRADYLRDPGRLRFVFADFQDPRLGTREGLLRHLLQAMGLPATGPCDLEDFLDQCATSLRTPTVILLDEIDIALERYPELDGVFWDGLRALATNQVEGNLGFVLASHEPPHLLARGSNSGSPFFNIFGYTTTLGPLTEDEARELIDSSPLRIPPAAADWILKESGRWPILLQILCRECLLALEEGDGDGDGDGDGTGGSAWQTEALDQIIPFRQLFA